MSVEPHIWSGNLGCRVDCLSDRVNNNAFVYEIIFHHAMKNIKYSTKFNKNNIHKLNIFYSITKSSNRLMIYSQSVSLRKVFIRSTKHTKQTHISKFWIAMHQREILRDYTKSISNSLLIRGWRRIKIIKLTSRVLVIRW